MRLGVVRMCCNGLAFMIGTEQEEYVNCEGVVRLSCIMASR